MSKVVHPLGCLGLLEVGVIAAGLRDAEREVGAEESPLGEGPAAGEAETAETAETPR
jgi:hypothetical protein